MSSKRTPQTAAKRDREQAVREKRLRKAEKKTASEHESTGPPPVFQEVPKVIPRPYDD